MIITNKLCCRSRHDLISRFKCKHCEGHQPKKGEKVCTLRSPHRLYVTHTTTVDQWSRHTYIDPHTQNIHPGNIPTFMNTYRVAVKSSDSHLFKSMQQVKTSNSVLRIRHRNLKTMTCHVRQKFVPE